MNHLLKKADCIFILGSYDKNGSKSIETRAATIKYQPVEVGDTLLFVCWKERLSKKVIKKQLFLIRPMVYYF